MLSRNAGAGTPTPSQENYFRVHIKKAALKISDEKYLEN
jgi:hypothetical protein